MTNKPAKIFGLEIRTSDLIKEDEIVFHPKNRDKAFMLIDYFAKNEMSKGVAYTPAESKQKVHPEYFRCSGCGRRGQYRIERGRPCCAVCFKYIEQRFWPVIGFNPAPDLVAEMSRPITATEVRQRTEDWKNSDAAKAAAREIEDKVLRPMIEPLIDHATNTLFGIDPIKFKDWKNGGLKDGAAAAKRFFASCQSR